MLLSTLAQLYVQRLIIHGYQAFLSPDRRRHIYLSMQSQKGFKMHKTSRTTYCTRSRLHSLLAIAGLQAFLSLSYSWNNTCGVAVLKQAYLSPVIAFLNGLSLYMSAAFWSSLSISCALPRSGSEATCRVALYNAKETMPPTATTYGYIEGFIHEAFRCFTA